MKKYLKKLLFVALALMPSLSINTFAMPSGSDPDAIPVKENLSLNSGSGPRSTNGGPDVIPVRPIPGPKIHRPRNSPDVQDDKPIVPAPNPNPNPNPGPRISDQEPYCYHIGGVVYIEADATITYINATVTRYDDNQVWSDASNSNTLSITTSADPGSYLLELTLSTGQSYQGKYIIE